MATDETTITDNEAPETESRALVLVGPSPQAEPAQSPTPRRPANFLAHLIATKAQLPQTRLRRRAEPAEALAAYRKTATLRG